MTGVFRRLTIRNRLALVLWGTALLAFAIAGAGLGLYQRLTIEGRARELMEPYAQVVAVGVAAAVEFEDPGRAQEILETLGSNPEILAADIELGDGRMLAGFSRTPGAETGRHPHLPDGVYVTEDRVELVQGIDPGARLHVVVSLDQLTRQTHRDFWIFGAGVLAVLVITIGQFLVLQRTLIRPVADLSKTAELVRTRADYRQRVPAEGGDEIARLGQGFNAMMEAVADRQKALQQLSSYQRAILDNAAYGIVSTDAGGLITSFNPAAERLLGYPAGEVVGRYTPGLWLDPEELARHARELTAQFGEPLEPTLDVLIARARRNLPNEFEWTLRRKDGTRVPALVNLTALRDETGGITGYVGLASDLTERKKAEQALRESAASLAAAQARAHLGSWELDLETGTGTWSAEMSRLHHRDPALPPPRFAEFPELVHPDDRADLQEVHARLLEATEPVQAELRSNPSLGPVRHFSITMDVVRDAAGRALRVLGTTLDITERKRAEVRIQRLNRTYAVLSDINQTIVRENDATAMLEATCRIAVEKGGFRMAWIGMLGAAGRIEIAAHAGATGDTVEVLRSLVCGERPDCVFTCEALRTGRHGVCNDIGRDPQAAPWREAALQREYHAMAALPLTVGEGVTGTFNLYAAEPGFFDAEELRLLDELAMDISFALHVARREEERRAAEDELRWKTAFFEAQVDSALDGIVVVDNRGRKILQNQRLTEMWKLPPEVAASEEDAVQVQSAARRTKHPQAFLDGVAHLYSHPDESSRDVIELIDGTVLDRSSFPVRDKAGRLYGRIWDFRDITQQRQLEEQFRQAQKLEAVGQLAGGVAHDFNNILTVIQGYGSLLMLPGATPAESAEAAQQIVQAAGRAANLTRQLLAFSRRQVLQPRPLDVNEIVTNLVKMLQRIVGEDVHLQLNLHPRPVLVRADAGMLDQVLLNLVVNARDAMPGGGRLFIETGEKLLAADEAASLPEASPGRYACLRVSDTGTGIAPEHLSHIFEPFFTTKPAGKGTGLGLATVFGIVRQHGGSVRAESEPGCGTTFHILLPAIEDAEAAAAEAAARPALRGGTETILLVEDDPAVRRLTRAVLERVGYRVLEAAHGLEALALAEQHRETIQLLFTDIVMPEGLNGRDLAARLQAGHPTLKVIFTSGYSADIAGRELSLEEGRNFIQKPSSPEQLLETVRRCLDG